MAFLLRFDQNNSTYVSNPSVMLNGHFRIDVDMEIRSFPPIQKLFDGDGDPTNERLDITLRETGADARNYCHFLANGQPAGSLSSFLNQRFIFSLVRDGTDSDQSLKEFSFIGCRFNQQAGQFLDADVYSIKVYDSSGVLIHDFNKQVLSGGNDTLFPDTIGGNDGTLINFPTDNSQWVFYSTPSAGVTADVTESSSDFSESSNASITANITAQITESASNFSESSSASFIGNISAQVTEVSASFSESSVATITNNLVTLSVTETSQDFGESVSASISGSLSALVTELSQSFTESSSADISANISAAVTELAQDFEDSALINLVGSFTVEVTETTSDFAEACYIQLPVQRLIPRKVISVNNRSGSTIRVRRRSSVIRVR